MSHNRIIEMNEYEFIATNAFEGMISPNMGHKKTCFAVLEENEELFSAYCHLLVRRNGIVDQMNAIEQEEENEMEREIRVIETNSDSKNGWVYVLKGGRNVYKIGLTKKSPSKRFWQISPKMPFEVTLLFTIKCFDVVAAEKHFHKHFSKKRLNNGSEWFKLNRKDIKYIKNYKEPIE